MKYIKTYKIFESKIASFKDTVNDLLSDLIDNDIKVTISEKETKVTISSSILRMSLSQTDYITATDISNNIRQLVSFLENDYSIATISTIGVEMPKTKVIKSSPKEIIDIQSKTDSNFLDNYLKKYENKRHYVTQVVLLFTKSNVVVCNNKINNDKAYILNDNETRTVIYDRSVDNAGRYGRRVYYILFKNNKIGALKLIYDLNSRSYNNFHIYDNFNIKLDFNKLEVYLSKYDIGYGTFNDAWYYIEEDYNNTSYTNPDNKF